MALERDIEKPTSPSGNRKLKLLNMNYMLDGTDSSRFQST